MASRLSVPVHPRDHALGAADSPITLVEYGDFECEFCGEAYPAVKDILKDFGERMRFVFRHFPLAQTHERALLAAQAAEAAGMQHRFWQMHDALFEDQKALMLPDIVERADRLGLDMTAFETALQDDDVYERIKNDFRGGVRSGVTGTPAFFINGQKYDGAWDGESLREALFAARVR